MARKNPSQANPSHCLECEVSIGSRRRFLCEASGAVVLAALSSAGVRAETMNAMRIAIVDPVARQGTEHTYPIPSEDGASIDHENDVIIVRQSNHIFAFGLACPHENTALRWYPQDQRFQCPRHQSRYLPDGTFVSGRATRNMDRFAIRRDGNNVVIDLSKWYRSDRQPSEWAAAVITL